MTFLTAEDIIHIEDELQIQVGWDKTKANAIKQQILDNQRIAEAVKFAGKSEEEYVKKVAENQEIVQRLKEKINTINKHLENLERQQYTGKNLGKQELTSADYIAISNLKMKLIEELTQFNSILENKLG